MYLGWAIIPTQTNDKGSYAPASDKARSDLLIAIAKGPNGDQLTDTDHPSKDYEAFNHLVWLSVSTLCAVRDAMVVPDADPEAG